MSKLSDAEAKFYKAATDYVRQELNRADALQKDKRVGMLDADLVITVRRCNCGFASAQVPRLGCRLELPPPTLPEVAGELCLSLS